jgi:hypothetical protein
LKVLFLVAGNFLLATGNSPLTTGSSRTAAFAYSGPRSKPLLSWSLKCSLAAAVVVELYLWAGKWTRFFAWMLPASIVESTAKRLVHMSISLLLGRLVRGVCEWRPLVIPPVITGWLAAGLFAFLFRDCSYQVELSFTLRRWRRFMGAKAASAFRHLPQKLRNIPSRALALVVPGGSNTVIARWSPPLLAALIPISFISVSRVSCI